MANQVADFNLLVGKTLNRAYIDANHNNVLLRFRDQSWFNMSYAPDIDELLYFQHITNHQFLFDAVITSVDVIDTYDVSFTTSKGVVTFNTILANPNYINGQLDTYLVTDVESYDDFRAVRNILTGTTDPNDYNELVYELITYDI